ncbi:MAG: cobalt-precorrin-5B (C(1))-methyltransferase [Gammaproteobacteria bacterium]|nr:cobalt-precorrin-5B (C(1))-methyltransferase [Gammaproteobacteria bacterium]
MRDETPENRQKLRSGYSTGACATATSLAAADLLINGRAGGSATITLPRGERVTFELQRCERISRVRAIASTIKDAGDDPDATHLATVFAEVELVENPGTRFYAAEGVGTVTRAGLSIPVGEPAINPVPRKMMAEHLADLRNQSGYAGGFAVHIGIVDGEKIALDTMNGRLGILGGLSILGTTGIVRPYSCSAFIASIHQSIDVAHANGVRHIAAATGSTSEIHIQERLALPDMAMVEMGDFAGAVLKHLRKVPMKRLSICGGFGKISKLAAGHHSLHNKDSAIDFGFLGQVAEKLGAGNTLVQRILESNTSLEALEYCQSENVPMANAICTLARATASKACKNRCEIDVYAINRNGEDVGTSLGS